MKTLAPIEKQTLWDEIENEIPKLITAANARSLGDANMAAETIAKHLKKLHRGMIAETINKLNKK